jgi:hypothetical protein
MAFGDDGMSLVEVLIASTLVVVLGTVIALTMSTLNTVSTSINSQYQEYDQSLPALAPLQTLLRAEVEPAPPVSGVPTPGFGLGGVTTTAPFPVGNNNLTFYANIGMAYNNVTSALPPNTTGGTGGPAMIVAQELDATGAPVTSSSTCSTTRPCSFQVTQYLPIINSAACSGLGFPSGTLCSTCPVTGMPSTNICQYPTTGKLIVNVSDMTNNPATQPIFSYNVLDPATGLGVNWTNLTNAQLLSMNSCTGATAATCPADYIQSVGIELMVSRSGAGTNGSVDEQTIVYRYPASGTGAGIIYPFQYTVAAG